MLVCVCVCVCVRACVRACVNALRIVSMNKILRFITTIIIIIIKRRLNLPRYWSILHH